MKNLTKQILKAISLLIVMPVYASYLVTRTIVGTDPALETHSQWMSLLPGHIGNFLRNAFYRLTLEHCDPTATICFGVLISKSATRIGRHVYIGPRCMLGWVELGDDVLLGPTVQITSGPNTHGIESLDRPIREQPGTLRCVAIGHDTWIGAASVVLADVGSQVVVGAHSTVTKSVPDRVISVGSPARVVRGRDELSRLNGESTHDQSGESTLCVLNNPPNIPPSLECSHAANHQEIASVNR